MRVKFEKGLDNKDILACYRPDGTATRTELGPGGAYHDLAHYVVESTMGYQEGFFGMIASGVDFRDFDHATKDRGWGVPDEGYFAEFLASLIQAAVGMGRVDPDYVAMLKKGAADMNLPFPVLPDAETLEMMRLQAGALTEEWLRLQPGEEMEVVFRLEDQK